MADELDMLAGEYVLGTLDATERRAFQRRMLTEDAAVAAVADWQRRLGPLLSAMPRREILFWPSWTRLRTMRVGRKGASCWAR